MILIALGALTVVWMGVADLVVPLFTGSGGISNALTAGLSRVLFPVVLLLSLTGLLVGILQSYDEFTIPAIAPAVWNLVILVGADRAATRASTAPDRVYAYAIAWLVATVVQFLMVAGRCGGSSSACRSRSTGTTRACGRC